MRTQKEKLSTTRSGRQSRGAASKASGAVDEAGCGMARSPTNYFESAESTHLVASLFGNSAASSVISRRSCEDIICLDAGVINLLAFLIIQYEYLSIGSIKIF